jgi:hypothetical protein
MREKDTIPVPTDWNAWVDSQFRTISLNRAPEDCFAVQIEGDRYRNRGIISGDFLICVKTDTYIPGSLHYWDTPKGQKARFGPVKSGKVLGVCVRVERDMPTGKEVQDA